MFNKSLNGIYSHLSFSIDENIPILCIAEPIYKNKKFLGMTIFKSKLHYLNEILQQRKGLGKTVKCC